MEVLPIGILARIVLVVGVLFFTAKATERCMKDYNELEVALAENPLNLDSLTRAFFPPNEPPSPAVEVMYGIASGTLDPDQQRLLQGMQGPSWSDDTFWNISEYDTWYIYWWSESPIYLFMDPGILERLALFTISVPHHTAQMFINRSFCEDYTIQNIPLPQYHLNQMTTLLKVYAIKGQSIQTGGLEAEISRLQGYTRLFNYTKFKVIGDIDDTKYKVNQDLLVGGLILQGVFVTTATPLVLNAQYPTLYRLANEDHMNALFIWATAVCCFVATVTIFTIDVYFFFIDRTGVLPYTSETIPLYALGAVLITVFIVINFIVAGFVKKKKDFPVPFVLQILFRRSCNKSVIQTLAIWSIVSFILMITFHLPFIFLAFVASPVQTGSTLLLYVTGVFSAISLTTLFFATFQKRNDLTLVSTTQKKSLVHTYLLKPLYLILFIFILVFTILFAICFVRITIYVGDVQSGGIPALVARLAPSVLLGGMGYLSKQVLEKYVPRDRVNMKMEEGKNEEATPLTSISDITSEDDFPAEQNSVMITDTAL